jgi:hypothetical protein
VTDGAADRRHLVDDSPCLVARGDGVLELDDSLFHLPLRELERPVAQQSCTSSRPSRTDSRSWSNWADTWVPTRVSSAETRPRPSSTVKAAASARGNPMRSMRSTAGIAKAVMSTAMATGITTELK